jgi:sugar/nucleoside kinase (ribokinase family)
MQDGIPTNFHYVLSYESERTILVRHEAYTYEFPKDLPAPKTLYLSSRAETVGDTYYEDLMSFLEKNPDVFFAFQPGTFQIKARATKLARVYARSNIFFCNKEESARILEKTHLSIMERLKGLAALGPDIVVMTDGRNGAYAYDGKSVLKVPMYPDLREPVERTGAGDAFASTVTTALSLGKPLEEALLWGPINSMSVVQKVGAQAGLLTQEELLKYLDRAPSSYNVETYTEANT